MQNKYWSDFSPQMESKIDSLDIQNITLKKIFIVIIHNLKETVTRYELNLHELRTFNDSNTIHLSKTCQVYSWTSEIWLPQLCLQGPWYTISKKVYQICSWTSEIWMLEVWAQSQFSIKPSKASQVFSWPSVIGFSIVWSQGNTTSKSV